MIDADVAAILSKLEGLEAQNRALREEIRGLKTEDRRLGVDDVAHLLGCSRRTVWRLVGSRQLAPGSQVGKARRWTLSEVDAYRTSVR